MSESHLPNDAVGAMPSATATATVMAPGERFRHIVVTLPTTAPDPGACEAAMAYLTARVGISGRRRRRS